MTYVITKDFDFAAAHHLDGVPTGHQCARVHGHNYLVRVSLTGPTVDDVGFLLDYGHLSPVRAWIDRAVDHRDLNDVMDDNPTAENLARWVAEQVRRLVTLPAHTSVSVGVSETPRTWAWFHESDGR